MFDWRYDRPDAYGGEKSLTRKKDETLEEWKTRVNVFERKNAIASQSRFDEDERRKELVNDLNYLPCFPFWKVDEEENRRSLYFIGSC